jgi:3-deoxy-manno-octulosonate cytidylyltransferase (CMP-KDO synthetase)
MSRLIVIPARLASTRLPEKPLLKDTGKYLIQHVYELACRSKRADRVVIATDDERIMAAAKSFGAEAQMTRSDHPSGTDRVAEVAAGIDCDLIVNLQGDEPQIDPGALDLLFDLLEKNPNSPMATLATPIPSEDAYRNPNCVKVVVDKKIRALYFSRSPIPYFRDDSFPKSAYQHIGVYGFRKEVLLAFSKLPVSDLERIEKLENLRMLENGISVHLAVIDHVGISIDTEEDFLKAKAYLDVKGE